MHKMQNAVVRAAKPEIIEQRVRFTGKIAIGKEQQLDERDVIGIDCRKRGLRLARRPARPL